MTSIRRLNYIGSKFQLCDWIFERIQEKVGCDTFKGLTIADLFAGTGIVSYNLRKAGSTVISNDAELYSSIITWAMNRSVYNQRVDEIIKQLCREITDGIGEIGFITRNYTPFEGCERMFFTVENGRRIDYLRRRIEEMRSGLTEDDYKFILASLLISADAVSNVPAVYGCYLKKFKVKANKDLVLAPIHMLAKAGGDDNCVYNLDCLSDELLGVVTADVAYLDPPYNERQYSKNYFPLNVIAEGSGTNLHGKTGIPDDCFLSPLCRKGEVEAAFEKIVGRLKVVWMFISYNSESLISRERMLEILRQHGEAGVFERDYKRFKSFDYNADKSIKEYLFWLRRIAS